MTYRPASLFLSSLFLNGPLLSCTSTDPPSGPSGGSSGTGAENSGGEAGTGATGGLSGGGADSGGASGSGASGTGAHSGTGATGGTGGESFPYESLREAAAASGVLIGSAVNASALSGDATYREILAREFDYVTPENSAKWGPLAPTSSTYDWDDTDAIVEFADENDQQVKGHTHVWHIQTPNWISESMTAEELRAAMKSHIEATLERYRGKMRAWDVVNEAVDTGTASGYTESIFYNVLGPDYIADAFRWARAADSDIELIYNEVGIERMGQKSDFTYEMIKSLLAEGVPIDGIGFQSHVSTHRYPSEFDLRENIRRFADLGLTVNISEVDARVRLMPGDEQARFFAERVAFQQIVGACVVEPGCDAISFWGFTDSYSWINDEGPEDPLIWDRNYTKKPAYAGVMAGLLGQLPERGPNHLLNAEFSAGTEGWATSGGVLTLSESGEGAGNAGCVSDRTSEADGLLQEGLLEAIASGGPLSFSAQIRVAEAAQVDGVLLVETAEGIEERNVATRPLAADTWTRLSGYLGLGFESTPTAISLLINGPEAGVELCATQVALQSLSVD